MASVVVAGRNPLYELTAADLVVRQLDELSFVNLKQLFCMEDTVSSQVSPPEVNLHPTHRLLVADGMVQAMSEAPVLIHQFWSIQGAVCLRQLHHSSKGCSPCCALQRCHSWLNTTLEIMARSSWPDILRRGQALSDNNAEQTQRLLPSLVWPSA